MFRKFTDFLFFGNVFVAFCVTCLSFSSFRIFGIQVDYLFLIFVFSSTLLVYNFHRLVTISREVMDYTQPDTRRFLWASQNKKVILTMIMPLIFVVFYSSKSLNGNHFYWLFPVIGVSLAYSYPVLQFAGLSWRLRDIPGLKIFFISSVVAIVTMLFPFLIAKQEMSDVILIALFARFLFVFAITIPFDIRDMGHDKRNLKTIPSVLGVERAKWFSVTLVTIHMFLYGYLFSQQQVFPQLFHALMVADLIAITSIILTRNSTSEKKYSIFIEGLMIVQPFLSWLFFEIG